MFNMASTSSRTNDLSEELNICFSDALFSTPNVLFQESTSTSRMSQRVSPVICDSYSSSLKVNAKSDNLSRKRKSAPDECDIMCKNVCGDTQVSQPQNLNINGSNIKDPKHLVMDPNLLFSSGDSNDTLCLDTLEDSALGLDPVINRANFPMRQQTANNSHIYAKPLSTNKKVEHPIFTGRVINPPNFQTYYKPLHEKPCSSSGIQCEYIQSVSFL